MLKELSSKNDDDPNSKKLKLDPIDDYKKLISLLLGSLYVSFQSQTFTHSGKTFERLIGKASNPTGKASEAAAAFPDQPVQFLELKSKPLGDIKRKESIPFLYF